jgi:tetraacyldisaccharide 4'-kinase
MGNFRDLPGESKRADMIMVTKTPLEATMDEKAIIRKRLTQKSGITNIFYTSIHYGTIVSLNTNTVNISRNTVVLLLTGIANPKPLIKHLKPLVKDIEHLSFSDHHAYTSNDILAIKQKFELINNPSKIILTTEKDAQRIRIPDYLEILGDLPIAYIPIEILFEDSCNQTLVEEQLLAISEVSVNES